MRKLRAILVTGLPGTGKTTVARRLARRYGAALLAKDVIKEQLLNVIGPGEVAGAAELAIAEAAGAAESVITEAAGAGVSIATRESVASWSRRLSDASFAVLFALAREHVAARASFLLEGNFRAGEHETALRELLESVTLGQVLCRVGENERIARLAARTHDPNRHPGHRDTDLLSQSNPATGRFLDLPGERWMLDTSAAPARGDGRGGRGGSSPDREALLAEPTLIEAIDRWMAR